MTEKIEQMPWANLPKSRPAWLMDIRVPSRKRPDQVEDANPECEKERPYNRSGR